MQHCRLVTCGIVFTFKNHFSALSLEAYGFKATEVSGLQGALVEWRHQEGTRGVSSCKSLRRSRILEKVGIHHLLVVSRERAGLRFVFGVRSE